MSILKRIQDAVIDTFSPLTELERSEEDTRNFLLYILPAKVFRLFFLVGVAHQ